MTQKELSYVEDAIGHEDNIIKIIDDNIAKWIKRIFSKWGRSAYFNERKITRIIGG